MKMVLQKATEKRATSAQTLSLGTRIVRATLPVFLSSLPFLSQAQTPIKVGNEFLVNTHTADVQIGSSISRLSNGHFIIVWESAEQDGNSDGIYAQRYNTSGELVGNEFRVNADVYGAQETPVVATLKDGSFVVAWQTSSGGGPGGSTVLAQRFNINGTALGNTISAHSTSARNVNDLFISALDDGGFVLSWAEYNQITYTNQLLLKTYSAEGSPVNSTISLDEAWRYSSTAGLEANGFILAKRSSSGVDAQIYNSDGSTRGAVIRVSDKASSGFWTPIIIRLANDDLIVAWQSTNPSSNKPSIYARRIRADGTLAGADILVNSHTDSNMSLPSATALDNGGYVITWQSYQQDGSWEGIFAQAFNSDDSRNGSEFLVNTTTEDRQIAPVISAISDNDFVVSWSSRLASDDYDIYAQRFQLEAVQADTMTLSLPQTEVLQGDVVTLPLQVSGTDIYGLDAVVSLSDTSKARISGGEYGEFLPSDERLSVPMGISDNQWDGALALMAPATAKSGEGDFAAVTLIAEQAGTVNLNLQAQMTDQQGNYLLQNSTDYTFTIAESVTLTGNISNLSTAGDYIFVTLLINGQRVTINPDGSFSVRVGLGDVTMTLSAPGYLTAEKQVNLAAGQADIDFGQINLVGGDSNGDNHIDIADLTLLLGAYRSVEGEQNGYVMAADFNRDTAINLQDLTLLGANFGKQGPQSW